MGMKSARIRQVSDAAFDVQTGKAAGTLTIAMTWGAGKREELVEAAVDWVIESRDELPRLLATSSVEVSPNA